MSFLAKADKIATLTSFTASVIAMDLDNLFLRKCVSPVELLVSGGGCKNLCLFSEIKAKCRGMRVSPIDDYGIPSQAREAITFALLAWWKKLEIPGNSTVVTGSKKSVVLGITANP